MFGPSSRYSATPSTTFTDDDGNVFVYKRMRHIPRDVPADAPTATVKPDLRVDQVGTEMLGDPTLYWHLCDVNQEIDPQRIAVAGTRLHVTPIDRRST